MRYRKYRGQPGSDKLAEHQNQKAAPQRAAFFLDASMGHRYSAQPGTWVERSTRQPTKEIRDWLAHGFDVDQLVSLELLIPEGEAPWPQPHTSQPPT